MRPPTDAGAEAVSGAKRGHSSPSFAVVRDDPFDLIEAEAREAKGDRDESNEPIAGGRQPIDNTETEEPDGSDAGPDGETEHIGEVLGDESTYYGTAEFERLKDRWTVWLVEVDCRERPGMIAACRPLKKAMKVANVPRGPGADWATIIIGPRYGGVRVDNITLWPHAWTVRTVIDEEIYPEESSRRNASERRLLNWRPAPKRIPRANRRSLESRPRRSTSGRPPRAGRMCRYD